jgi:tetratricopeptide (TPR) repeat protein/protein involved in polysaccharide export with SLBB domain
MKNTFLFRFVLCALCVAATRAESGAAVPQDGSRANVYYSDGTRFALEGRLGEAVAAFEQAVALDPNNGNAFYNLGNVYSELGRWEDAVAAYRKAVSLNKKDLEAYNGLGIALARRGVYPQAVKAFEKAIELYPKWAEPHYHLSQVYRQLGQDVAAQVAYSDSVRLRPDYATSPPRTFTTPGMTASAAAPGRKASAPAPAPLDSADAGRSSSSTPAGSATPRGGETLRGETASKVAALNSGDAKAYQDLGLKLSRAGRHEEAVTALRQAVMLDRDDASAHVALGDEYAALGRWRESVDAYEQATRLDPRDAKAYERLGRSYAKLRENAATPGGGDGAAVGARASAPAGTNNNASVPRERDTAAESEAAPAARPATRNSAPAPGTVRPGASALAAPKGDADPTAVYRVGAGDVLDIRVLNQRESGATAYKVTPAGLLVHPRLAEPLQVSGLTTDEIAARLGSELRRATNGGAAEVAVAVSEYASHAIIVSGLVKDPGTKIMRREGVPLYVIIAHAQPLPEAGRVLVASHATGQTAAFDLSDARAMNVLVRPGDVITVQPRTKQYFYIAGAVPAPGQKEFHVGLTLTQAILAAGGVAQPTSGPPASATVARQGPDGKLVATRYNLRDIGAGRTPDPSVEPGDRIEVFR